MIRFIEAIDFQHLNGVILYIGDLTVAKSPSFGIHSAYHAADLSCASI